MSAVCEYSLEQKADFTLAEWMHVTGYTDEVVRALSDEMIVAIFDEAHEQGSEFHVTNDQSAENPFTEYVVLMDKECKRRGINYV